MTSPGSGWGVLDPGGLDQGSRRRPRGGVLPTPGTSSIRAWPSAEQGDEDEPQRVLGTDDRLGDGAPDVLPETASVGRAGAVPGGDARLGPGLRLVRRRVDHEISSLRSGDGSSPAQSIPEKGLTRRGAARFDRRWHNRQPMAGPELLLHGTPGFALPAFDRLAPPPSPDLMGSLIEAQSRPGDVVVDLFARGGWVARAALDRQRKAAPSNRRR